jgi:hypothetical protein
VPASSSVDSHDYRFAFSVTDQTEVPEDFGVRLDADFITGVFLPRDDPDWFGRIAYPPKLLLLFQNRVELLSHPSTRKPLMIRIPMAELDAVESGGALLLGWIVFHAGEATAVRYNRRTKRPVEDCLRRLRERLCQNRLRSIGRTALAGELSLKFRNLLLAESRPGERPESIWYQPSSESVRQSWLFRLRRTEPADLLALMSDRLLWLTDRLDGSRDPYGWTATYVPLRELQGVNVSRSDASSTLFVRMNSGRHWCIHVSPNNLESAHKFVDHISAPAARQEVPR